MKLLRVIAYVCLVAATFVGGTAAAKDRDVALVLGDSVAFAYIDSAGYEYINPDNFLIRETLLQDIQSFFVIF